MSVPPAAILVSEITPSPPLPSWHLGQMSGDPTQGEVNSALSVLPSSPGIGRETRLRRTMRKSSEAPWASFKFRLGSASLLTTSGAGSAALEHSVRSYPYEEIARPTAAALAP